MVEGGGVAAGVGPDDADGGGAAFEAVVEVELGQGEVLLVVGVEVVGGEDALAVAEEGQAVAGEEGLYGAAVLVALVGQGRLGVLEQGVELCAGGAVLDGAGDGAQEVAAGAGDVVQGDGDLSAGVAALGGEGDAFVSLGDGALRVGLDC